MDAGGYVKEPIDTPKSARWKNCFSCRYQELVGSSMARGGGLITNENACRRGWFVPIGILVPQMPEDSNIRLAAPFDCRQVRRWTPATVNMPPRMGMASVLIAGMPSECSEPSAPAEYIVKTMACCAMRVSETGAFDNLTGNLVNRWYGLLTTRRKTDAQENFPATQKNFINLIRWHEKERPFYDFPSCGGQTVNKLPMKQQRATCQNDADAGTAGESVPRRSAEVDL